MSHRTDISLSSRVSRALRYVILLPFLLLLRLYQWVVSPLLGPSCRYAPSCSDYAKEAVQEHGVIAGSVLSAKRICRCHPWGGHGFDPVPLKGSDSTAAKI